ncbi:MAG: hypothetical protein HY323_05515 [Betaproteobacteria bacterium]|nr:hypothetical protein [Betaproteobacteria bacterium]
MALPNDSVLFTPGSGATVATHTVSSKEYEADIQADPEGELEATRSTFWVNADFRVAAWPAAGDTALSLMNPAASGKRILLLAVMFGNQGTVNKTLRLVRATSGGSGGTAETPFGRNTAVAPVATIQVLPTTQPTGKDATVGLRLEQPISTGRTLAIYPYLPGGLGFFCPLMPGFPIEVLQGVGIALDADGTGDPVAHASFVWQEVTA